MHNVAKALHGKSNIGVEESYTHKKNYVSLALMQTALTCIVICRQRFQASQKFGHSAAAGS